MAVKIRRSYKGAAVSALLDASGVTSATQTSISMTTSPTTWPTGKFFVVVAPGTAQEEKMCVTLSGSTLTVVDPAVTSTSASANGRGVDNTTARSTIAGAAVVYPVFTAVDADEANELTSKFAAQGSMVYQGASTFTELTVGTAGQVLKVNSGATAPEWGQVATAGIADSAVTLAKIASAVQAFLVPVGTISAYAGATAPTGWLLCDGTSTTGYTSLAALVGATTPDLRGKFLMGKTASGTGSTLLGSGGSTTIAEGNLPSHSHANTASASTSVTVNSGGSHAHTATSSTEGAHVHVYSRTDSAADAVYNVGDSLASIVYETISANTQSAGAHNHTITVDSGGSHSHTASATTTVTMSNAATGSGTAYYQPFVAVSYIIKHD